MSQIASTRPVMDHIRPHWSGFLAITIFNIITQLKYYLSVIHFVCCSARLSVEFKDDSGNFVGSFDNLFCLLLKTCCKVFIFCFFLFALSRCICSAEFKKSLKFSTVSFFCGFDTFWLDFSISLSLVYFFNLSKEDIHWYVKLEDPGFVATSGFFCRELREFKTCVVIVLGCGGRSFSFLFSYTIRLLLDTFIII